MCLLATMLQDSETKLNSFGMKKNLLEVKITLTISKSGNEESKFSTNAEWYSCKSGLAWESQDKFALVINAFDTKIHFLFNTDYSISTTFFTILNS